jgi:hypothetical protein
MPIVPRVRVCLCVCVTVLSLAALGCDWVGFSFSRVGPPQTPKPAACAFDILTEKPSRPFTEVGVLASTRGCTSVEGDFRREVTADVCGAGGDAVVAEVNPNKCVVRASVIRYSPAPLERGPSRPRVPPAVRIDQGETTGTGPKTVRASPVPSVPLEVLPFAPQQ